MQRFSRHTTCALVALLSIGLAGCAKSLAPTPLADSQTQPTPELLAEGFPVVEPFPLDRAGSKVSVEFELPPPMRDGRLRPVFIGFRQINQRGGRSKEEMAAWVAMSDYLSQEPIPLQVRLARIGPTGLSERIVVQDHDYDASRTPAVRYFNVEGDVVQHHGPGSTDNSELIAVKRYDYSRAYLVHEIVQIKPPTPGRYRLEVVNLKDHPQLLGPDYELLVSHYYDYEMN